MPADPHILWLTENYHPGRGGMAQSCDRIVHSLRMLGLTVDVVHFTRHVDRIRIEGKRNGRYIGLPPGDDPAHGLNSLWNTLEVDPMRSRFTHVVAFGGTGPLLAGPIFAAWLGLPLVTLFRGNDFDTGIFSPRRTAIVRQAIEASTSICVVSRDKGWKIRALYPDTEPVWIPNGIDLSEWRLIESDRAQAREWRQENVPSGGGVLGIIGKIKHIMGGLFFV
jgi:glycosyltransferase involved in cell wall biosynthesis